MIFFGLKVVLCTCIIFRRDFFKAFSLGENFFFQRILVPRVTMVMVKIFLENHNLLLTVASVHCISRLVIHVNVHHNDLA